MTNSPRNTYSNPEDGNTYYLAPLPNEQSVVLWACPTNVDGSADFESAIPETDFAERLTDAKRQRIVAELAD